MQGNPHRDDVLVVPVLDLTLTHISRSRSTNSFDPQEALTSKGRAKTHWSSRFSQCCHHMQSWSLSVPPLKSTTINHPTQWSKQSRSKSSDQSCDLVPRTENKTVLSLPIYLPRAHTNASVGAARRARIRGQKQHCLPECSGKCQPIPAPQATLHLKLTHWNWWSRGNRGRIEARENKKK